MQPTVMLLCNTCGQISNIEKVGVLTDAPPRFCPFCGGENMRPVKSSFVNFEATCFAPYDTRLVQAAYYQWAMNENKTGRSLEPRFLPYLQKLFRNE